MHNFSAPLTPGLTEGRLHLSHEFSIMLKSDPNSDDLFWAEFEEPRPLVDIHEGRVRIDWRYDSIWPFHQRNQRGTIVLNAKIPWRIEISSGASSLIAGLADLDLLAFKLKTGASKVDLTLGQPRGTVPIDIACGATSLELSRPANVATRLDAATGASSINFDSQKSALLGGEIRTESGGYSQAVDRYDISLKGGASSIKIATY